MPLINPPASVEFAPAKVNLSLHVIGRRADGYHLLDSLVVFPRVGDIVEAEDAGVLSLAISGPFADRLTADGDNLVLRAAVHLLGGRHGAALRLRKQLPVAAGLGGGSADAAAVLRLLARRHDLRLPQPADLVGLGADVPVCVTGRSSRMRGIGEQLATVSTPPFWLVLAHVGAPVSTAAVFAALNQTENSPMPGACLNALRTPSAFFRFLAGQRNDLELAAIALCPPIAHALAALAAQPGAGPVRVSGSGAACFGMFETESSAFAAAEVIQRAEPTWWVVAASVGRNSGQAGDDEAGESE